MPAACAASTRPVPFGTSTERSSTVTDTGSDMGGLAVALVDRRGREDSFDRRVAVEGAASEVDVRLVLVAELVDVAEHGDRVGITERAQALSHDPVAHREEQVEVGLGRSA